MDPPQKNQLYARLGQIYAARKKNIPSVEKEENSSPSIEKNDSNVNDSNSNNSSTNTNENDKMSATAILIHRGYSFFFQKRTLTLNRPIKIGRSVAKTLPKTTNGIFNCKVLSRNHALLWYDGGKFFLQDTGSSNGTFVNNTRLSSSGQESSAREVYSGDIVQFGVDVIENTKKVTHGCIVAALKLYLPDGKEAKASSNTTVGSVDSITYEDLYTLNHFVQEAMRREKLVNFALAHLQLLVENTREAVNQSWKALIGEDKLLSRIETVESQLVVYSKKFADDEVRKEVVRLQEEKAQYQEAAKETVQKVLQEKLEISQRLMQLESRLKETEEECQSLHEVSKQNQSELRELAIKYSDAQKELQETTNKLLETEDQLKKISDQMEEDNKALTKQLKYQLRIERVLQSKLINSKFDSINILKQVTALQNYLQTLKDANLKETADENIESKDDMKRIYTAMNEILLELSIMIKPSWEDDQINSEDMEAIKNSISLDESPLKEELYDFLSDSIKESDYILPPSSRRTLINGNGNSENLNVNFESDSNSEITDICTVIGSSDEVSEEIEKQSEEIVNFSKEFIADGNDLPRKLKVRFAGDNEKQINIEYESEEKSVKKQMEEVDFGNFSSDSEDSPLNSYKSVTVTLNQGEKSDLNDNERKSEIECNNEEFNGDYVKTLKPNTRSDSSQTVQAQDYILQSFISCLDSLKEDDTLAAQNLVKRELEELKDWLVRESSDFILSKLKDIYYRSKNESQRIQEVNEELVILKEKCSIFAEEKAELVKNYQNLENQCKNSNTNYVIPIHIFAPIMLALTWLLFEKLF